MSTLQSTHVNGLKLEVALVGAEGRRWKQEGAQQVQHLSLVAIVDSADVFVEQRIGREAQLVGRRELLERIAALHQL
jgi:hypothetical protein